MIRVLLTGFGPFPGAPFNPTVGLIKALARKRRPALAGIARSTHVFATTYVAVDRDLPNLLARRPDIVLMFGLAGRRRQLCIETCARNAVSVLVPDAKGYRPQHGIIAPAEAPSLNASAPFAELLGAARAGAFPATLSRDPGRYLCNYAYWRALHRARGGRPLVQFIHIPPVSIKPRRRRPAAKNAMSLARLITASEAILIALVAASRR